MTTQKALRISLPALFLVAFFLSPLRSDEKTSANNKRTFSTQLQANGENTPEHTINLDLTVPVNNNKKEKDSDHHGPDLMRNKRHADEDRHEHHHHDFDKSKSKKRVINMLTSFMLKIIIAVSYFSILLCSYVSMSH